MHITVILLSLLVISNNFTLNKELINPDKTIIASLMNEDSGNEETAGNDVVINTMPNLPVNADSEAFVKNTTAPGDGEDFKIAAHQELMSNIITSQDNSAVVKPTIISGLDNKAKTTNEITYYVVENGDTPESIANTFGVNLNTILWENNLNQLTARFIKPGQILAILPISGISHKIKKGETIEKIAEKYKADSQEVIEFNNLADASQIQKDQILIIPNGKKPLLALPKPAPARPRPTSIQLAQQTAYPSSSYYDWLNNNKSCHKFYPGHCTSYVAYKWETERGQCVPSWGNAKSWLWNAVKAGYSTCVGNKKCSPKVGGIIVLRESFWGHVAYVEGTSGNTVTFSEMNYGGRWKTDKRTLATNDSKILGYIY